METDCMDDVCAPPSISVQVEEIKTDFDGKSKINDIALLRLSRNVEFSGISS